MKSKQTIRTWKQLVEAARADDRMEVLEDCRRQAGQATLIHRADLRGKLRKSVCRYEDGSVIVYDGYGNNGKVTIQDAGRFLGIIKD